jgi:hypothetical protein
LRFVDRKARKRVAMVVQRHTSPGARLLRGNLHTHTSISDGRRSPEEVLAFYAENGYDFVALTDHWRASSLDGERDGLLVIPGLELDGRDPALGAYHLVGLGLSDTPRREDVRSLGDAVGFVAKRGGKAILCHPYWCGMPSWAVVRSFGVIAVEIFNTTCEVTIAKGFSTVHWDDTLAAGRRIWGVAVDDAHWSRPDYGAAWVMVEAEERSVEAILQALCEGRFYSSSGPEIKDFAVEGRVARAVTTPAKRLAFVCDRHMGYCAYDETGRGITEACYTVPEEASYVRLEVDDYSGRRAWSNPIWLSDGGQTRR